MRPYVAQQQRAPGSTVPSSGQLVSTFYIGKKWRYTSLQIICTATWSSLNLLWPRAVRSIHISEEDKIFFKSKVFYLDMGEGKIFSIFSMPNCAKDTQNSYSYSKYSIHTTSQSKVNCICVISESDLEWKFPPNSYILLYTCENKRHIKKFMLRTVFPKCIAFKTKEWILSVLFKVVKS